MRWQTLWQRLCLQPGGENVGEDAGDNDSNESGGENIDDSTCEHDKNDDKSNDLTKKWIKMHTMTL